MGLGLSDIPEELTAAAVIISKKMIGRESHPYNRSTDVHTGIAGISVILTASVNKIDGRFAVCCRSGEGKNQYSAHGDIRSKMRLFVREDLSAWEGQLVRLANIRSVYYSNVAQLLYIDISTNRPLST